MGAIIAIILITVLFIILILLALGPATGALFWGRKLPWLWFALSSFLFTQKIVAVALYMETDNIRALSSVAAGIIAFGLAFLLHKRFPKIVLVFGSFLATALIVIQVLGPLLNPAPQWFVMAVLAASGIAGAIWTRTNPVTATIVLSSLIGSGVWADQIVDSLKIDETSRFQVQIVIALFGLGFQIWQERRERKKSSTQVQGVSI